jgi:hypothetical protein
MAQCRLLAIRVLIAWGAEADRRCRSAWYHTRLVRRALAALLDGAMSKRRGEQNVAEASH